MDINALRILVTILAVCAFVAIAVWAYLPARRRAQEELAESILRDEEGERFS